MYFMASVGAGAGIMVEVKILGSSIDKDGAKRGQDWEITRGVRRGIRGLAY